MMVFVEVNYCFGGRSYFYKLSFVEGDIKKWVFCGEFFMLLQYKGFDFKKMQVWFMDEFV